MKGREEMRGRGGAAGAQEGPLLPPICAAGLRQHRWQHPRGGLRLNCDMLDRRPLSALTAIVVAILSVGWILSARPAPAQMANQRLILKDGSYQEVTQYAIKDGVVRYFSAERDDWEELPSDLVDWAATKQWAKDHAPGALPAGSSPPGSQDAAEIDREERQERAARAARTPEVAPGLVLPDRNGVWALDTYRDQPELVGLSQNAGNVNPATGHNITPAALNPMGRMKQAIEIPGAVSKVKLHVDSPAFYVSLTAPQDEVADASAFTVNTHGAGSDKTLGTSAYSSPGSQYAIVRLHSNFRHDYRQASDLSFGGNGGMPAADIQNSDILPTTAQILPGKHWMKLTPQQPLSIGDYALMEILAPGEVNLSVWDFRIDPQGPDNQNAIIPLQR